MSGWGTRVVHGAVGAARRVVAVVGPKGSLNDAAGCVWSGQTDWTGVRDSGGLSRLIRESSRG